MKLSGGYTAVFVLLSRRSGLHNAGYAEAHGLVLVIPALLLFVQ